VRVDDIRPPLAHRPSRRAKQPDKEQGQLEDSPGILTQSREDPSLIGEGFVPGKEVAEPPYGDAFDYFFAFCARRMWRKYQDFSMPGELLAEIQDKAGFGIVDPAREGRCKDEYPTRSFRAVQA